MLASVGDSCGADVCRGMFRRGALLGITFLLNIGSAMNDPAWQAIVPEFVPLAMIPETVSLNAASNNLVRAVGPALAGLMVAGFQRVHTGGACLRFRSWA